MDEQYSAIESLLRQSFAGVVWSHKIQEKQADIYASRYHHFETAKIVTASVTSAGIVSTIFTDQLWIKIVSALISFCTIFLNAYFKSFDLSTLTKQHKDTANKLWDIREDLQFLIMQVKTKMLSVEEATTSYQATLEKLKAIYEQAPNTTDKAVDLASKALKVTQDNTFTDDEINSFLPEALRRD